MLAVPSAAGVILDKGCDVFSDPNALWDLCTIYTIQIVSLCLGQQGRAPGSNALERH